MLRGRWSAAIAAAIFMAAAGSAHAATIVVNTTSGASPEGDGQCSLSEAIADVDAPGASSGDCAPAAFGANTITLGPHTYPLGPPAGGTVSALSIAGSVTSLHITGAGESSTMIDASASGTRALEIAAGASVALSDLTVTGGHAPDGAPGGSESDGSPGANGGAILNAGTLTLSDAAVTNSTAGNGGSGGPGLPGGSGIEAVGGDGGPGGLGGGILNSGALSLNGATISGNQGGAGGPGGPGATAADGSGGGGGSGGPGGGGGGVLSVGGTVTVIDSTVNANHAGSGGLGSLGSGEGGDGGDGGGLSMDTAVLSVTNSTFASNAAGDGGAGGPSATPGPFAGAGGQGGSGGALVDDGQPSAQLQNVTMAGNNVGDGGAPSGGSTAVPGNGGGMLDEDSSPVLRDSLLYLNGGGNCSGLVTDAGHNLSFPGGGCPISFASANPNLGPLQDNGGPTKTISLQPGSAAVDAGAGCPATDQRGVPRPAGKACDIGAYEVAPPKATTQAPSSVSAHGATLVAQVTPNSGDAGVSFQFGRSRKYGSQSKPQPLDGVTAVPVSAKLGRLKDHTTYHYRVSVSSADGTTVGADRTFTTSDKPVLRSLRVKPARLKVAGAATTIRYTDNLAARTRFTVLRAKPGVRQGKRCVARTGHGGHGRSCTRYVRVGGFSHTDVIGSNRVPFSGRLGSHRLTPGRYELTAVARAGRHSGTARTVKFTVVG